MAKLTLEFDYHNPMWCDDSQYNELYIQSKIAHFKNIMKIDGVVMMIEVLKAFGYSVGDFSIDVLTRYWADGEIDITYVRTSDNDYKITFKTDN